MQCNSFPNPNSSQNGSDIFHIGMEFGGIPSNLLTNFVAWLLILLMFFFARKSMLNIMTDKLGRNWSRIFQLFHGSTRKDDSDVDTDQEVVSNYLGSLQSQAVSNESLRQDGGDLLLENRKRELARLKPRDEEIHGIRSWIQHSLKCFSYDDQTMKLLAGPDGYQYLRFQKYLMVLVAISFVYAMVLLPINLTGDNYSNVPENSLARTTINNRNSDDNFLYFHTLIAFLFFPISVYVMRQFSAGLNFRDVSLEITKTLLVEKIPLHMCTKEIVKKHFDEAYPEMPVNSVSLAYDVKELMQVSQKLRNAKDAIKQAKKYNDAHPGEPLTMKPILCSRFCSFICCCSERVDVLEYYEEEKVILERDVETLTETSLHNPLGIAFVSFDSINHSKKVYDDFISSFMIKSPAASSLNPSLRPSKWKVSFAPIPRDIHWQNLKEGNWWLTVKKLISDLILIVIFLFLTTPEIVVTQLQPLLNLTFGNDALQIPEFILAFLPTLVLWTTGSLIPSIISWSVRRIGYWYKSEENFQVMRRTFWYLWLCLIISPAFGLTSGLALLENFFGPESNKTGGIRWECVGLPDSGAIFINYVITSALIGTSMQLLRVPELLWYAIQVCFSNSPADNKAIERAITFEFRFGEEYAKLLIVFAMVVMLSTSTPLITIFGFLYFVLKYFVDKHNLAWVYEPSEIDLDVHSAAINFVIFSVGFIQFYMSLLSIVRQLETEDWNLANFGIRSIVSFGLLLASAIVFFAQAFSQICKKISPIRYEDPIWQDMERDTFEGVYLPDALIKAFVVRRQSRESENVNEDREEVTNTGYGTFVDDLISTDDGGNI